MENSRKLRWKYFIVFLEFILNLFLIKLLRWRTQFIKELWELKCEVYFKYFYDLPQWKIFEKFFSNFFFLSCLWVWVLSGEKPEVLISFTTLKWIHTYILKIFGWFCIMKFGNYNVKFSTWKTCQNLLALWIAIAWLEHCKLSNFL